MSIIYNGVELENAIYIPEWVRHESLPDRDLILEKIIKEDGSLLVDAPFGVKVIPMAGVLVKDTRAEFEEALDELKKLFRTTVSGAEKNLDILFAGATRRYSAVVRDFVVNREHYNINFARWALNFVVPKGYGRDTELIEIEDTLSGFAEDEDESYSEEFEVEFGGSRAPLPEIKLWFDSGYETTIRAIAIECNGKRLIYEFAADSYPTSEYPLIINCEEKTVYWSGLYRSFLGAFPEFDVGTNVLKVIVGEMKLEKTDFVGGDEDIKTYNGSATLIIGQTFVIPYKIKFVSGLYWAGQVLYKLGNPGQPVMCSIRDPADNWASLATDLSVSIAHDAAGWQGPGFYLGKVFFSNIGPLEANKRYGLAVFSQNSPNASNCYYWKRHITDLYRKGEAADGPNVNTITYHGNKDHAFCILMGGKYQGNPVIGYEINYNKLYL